MICICNVYANYTKVVSQLSSTVRACRPGTLIAVKAGKQRQYSLNIMQPFLYCHMYVSAVIYAH